MALGKSVPIKIKSKDVKTPIKSKDIKKQQVSGMSKVLAASYSYKPI